MEIFRDFFEPLFIEHFRIIENKHGSYRLALNADFGLDFEKEFAEKNFLNYFKFEFRRNLKKYSSDMTYLYREQAENLIFEVVKALAKVDFLKDKKPKSKFYC